MAPADRLPVLRVARTADFDLTGDGSNPAWQAVAWEPLTRRPGSTHPYEARLKLLYSPSGLYILFDGTDAVLTASLQGENLHLWTEDVYEAFFWTDETYPIYFEYEISPLNQELPLIIPNFDGDYLGWIPWDYFGERRIRKAVAVRGGRQEPGAEMAGWSAEVFVPYALLKPLRNVPPEPGMRWRANFYRNDYDRGEQSTWNWATVAEDYHAIDLFGYLLFE